MNNDRELLELAADDFQNSQEVRDWIKEVVSNGYHKYNTLLELQILEYFYERLFESEMIDNAVGVLLGSEDEATAGYYLNKVVKSSLERTTNLYKASVAAHLGDKAYYDQYF